MKKGNMRYDELALECGYYDEAHMMKEFKNYAGMTLEQYRKLQGGNIHEQNIKD